MDIERLHQLVNLTIEDRVVLYLFERYGERVGVVEIAQALGGRSKSGTSETMNRLIAKGLVEQPKRWAKFQLSPSGETRAVNLLGVMLSRLDAIRGCVW